MARGWTFGKIIIVILIVLVLALAGIGWYMWSKHLGPLVQGGRAQRAQGTELGRTADAQECLARTFERYGEAPGIKSAILYRIFLDSCLSTCRPAAGFCEGVPSERETVASARWRVSVCGRAGQADETCHTLLVPVQEYCEGMGGGAYEQGSAGGEKESGGAGMEEETAPEGAEPGAEPAGSEGE